MNYPLNQFATSSMQGANVPPPEDVAYEDKPYDYIYNPPGGALAPLAPLVDTLAIDTDADFYCRAWYITLFTGLFTIQITDSTGYRIQSAPMNSGAISQDPANPTVWSPEHPFPAGGKILINITDTSGAPNPVQIAFKGVKRFRIDKGKLKAA